jgi:hypothetical protein
MSAPGTEQAALRTNQRSLYVQHLTSRRRNGEEINLLAVRFYRKYHFPVIYIL